MARFTAPPHTTEVFLPSGPARVIDGFVTLDNPTDGDLRALQSVGFVAEVEKAAPVAAPSPTPAAAKDKE